MLRWQEAWQRGQPIDTAELCAGTPELRDEVRRHLEALRAMEALLDRLPAADSAATVPPGPGGDARQTLAQDSVATAAGVQVPGYEILEELGRGGMGVVYKARHIKLNRAVALKMVLAGGHPGSEDRIRFLAEAEAVAALQHANIVQVFEVGQHDSLPFMALEYVNGGSLADKLRDGLPLPREAAWLVEQLAQGMAAAHAKGIIHRDLKPHNVLLRRKSEIQNPKSEIRKGMRPPWFGFRISDFGFRTEDHRLRPGQESRGRQWSDADGGGYGHAVVHGSGAGRGQERRWPGRGHLCPGRDPVRVPDGPAAVSRSDAA